MVKKIKTKKKVKKPDFKKFDSFISKYINKSSAEQLQAISDGSKKYNIGKTEAKQLLNEKLKNIHKVAKAEENAKEKETSEYEKKIKLQAKEMKAEQKRINEEAVKKEKTLIIEELESTWESCNDELFIVACEIDWKKAKHYFVKDL